MRKLVAYELLSLDGVAEEPGDWMFDVGEEVFGNLAEVIEGQDAILLGRRTYDYWAGYWPTSDVQPFADFVNSTTKHVFTSTPLEPSWPNAVAVQQPLAEYVTGLKQQEGGDIGVHGSISIVQALLGAGLVDELRLVLAPTLAKKGRRLFPRNQPLDRLTLLSSERTAAGDVLLAYEVRRGR